MQEVVLQREDCNAVVFCGLLDVDVPLSGCRFFCKSRNAACRRKCQQRRISTLNALIEQLEPVYLPIRPACDVHHYGRVNIAACNPDICYPDISGLSRSIRAACEGYGRTGADGRDAKFEIILAPVKYRYALFNWQRLRCRRQLIRCRNGNSVALVICQPGNNNFRCECVSRYFRCNRYFFSVGNLIFQRQCIIFGTKRTVIIVS